MEDWQYRDLRRDMERLEKRVDRAEDRAYKVERWQQLLPMRVTEWLFWLIALGVVAFSMAAAATSSY
jgi:hypothetical protein